MTSTTQRRLSASQRARNDFDAYIASGGDKYPVFEAWQEDYLPEPDYSDFAADDAIPRESDGSRWGDPENGDNDAYEIFY